MPERVSFPLFGSPSLNTKRPLNCLFRSAAALEGLACFSRILVVSRNLGCQEAEFQGNELRTGIRSSWQPRCCWRRSDSLCAGGSLWWGGEKAVWMPKSREMRGPTLRRALSGGGHRPAGNCRDASALPARRAARPRVLGPGEEVACRGEAPEARATAAPRPVRRSGLVLLWWFRGATPGAVGLSRLVPGYSGCL